MAQKRGFSIYDHIDFPDYVYQEYPKALQPPDRAKRLAEAKAALKEATKIEDKNQREAAMELARKDVEAAFHAHVRVDNVEEEKALLAKWKAEAGAPKAA